MLRCRVNTVCKGTKAAWIYSWQDGPKFDELTEESAQQPGVVGCCESCRQEILQRWRERKRESALERVAWNYGDLTQPRWRALELAAGHNLAGLHPRVQELMSELIDEQLQITWAGQELHSRILRYYREGVPAPAIAELTPEHYDLIVDKKRARAILGSNGKWLRAVHLKLMYALALHPGLSFKMQAIIMGADQMVECREHGLVSGECTLGAPWELTRAGVELVQQLLQVSDD